MKIQTMQDTFFKIMHCFPPDVGGNELLVTARRFVNFAESEILAGVICKIQNSNVFAGNYKILGNVKFWQTKWILRGGGLLTKKWILRGGACLQILNAIYRYMILEKYT